MLKTAMGRSAIIVLACSLSISAHAMADGVKRVVHIPSGNLDVALEMLARQSGSDLVYRPDQVQGLKTRGVDGELSTEEAVTRLLQGTPLTLSMDATGAMLIALPTPTSSTDSGSARGRNEPARAERRSEERRGFWDRFRLAQSNSPSSSTSPSGEEKASAADTGATRGSQKSSVNLDEVVVTGTHIAGAPIASTVITLSQGELILEGSTDLGEAIRNLPQNFSGGQNPTIGVGNFGSTNTNFNGTSSVNLRGLGADASLTLLNGHRLAYDAALQSVDISAIPLAAVDRIEIVADGASALYGSDAVGGVVNVILKRDYDGATGSARVAAATEGGDSQEQYSAVLGKTWSSGGFITAYNYEHDNPIFARQRSYSTQLFGEADLLRFQKVYNVLLSGHQQLTPGTEITLDAVYNHRETGGNIPFTTTQNYLFSGELDHTIAESFSIAPSLKVELDGGWSASLTGSYAKDKTTANSLYYDDQEIFYTFAGCNCNELRSAEVNAEGRLFELPGGTARLALGAGYRWIGYDVAINGGLGYSASRDSDYGYGELSLPVVGPGQQIPFLNALTFSAALRYERYPGMESVATPKMGVIYAPTDDVDLKASWGKSFKAPTLVQEYFQQFAYIYPTSEVGGSGFPAGATVLYLEGGNTALKPERADTWSTTLAVHPGALPGARIELSYFDIRYRERVVQPIISTSGALDNPTYRQLIDYDVTDAKIDAAIARAPDGLSSPFDIPYNRADVVAILDNRNLNVSDQKLHGVDVLAMYDVDLTRGGTLTVTGNGSYLHSSQRLSAGQPDVDLAGTIFNPPHVRARGGVSWDDSSIVLASFLSYIGGVTDNRSTTIRHVGSMTTLDLTAQARLRRPTGILQDVDLTFSAQNVLNEKPGVIFNSVAYRTPYDSTNYSSVGRFLSLTLTKRF
ncbi:MAG: TonB-dependent receptor [Gammaproteobacteria bacterium]